MLWPAAHMMNVILRQFLLELRRPAPRGVLPPVVGEKFLWRPIFACGAPVCLDDAFRALAAIDSQPGYVPGMIVYEANDVGGLPDIVNTVMSLCQN